MYIPLEGIWRLNKVAKQQRKVVLSLAKKIKIGVSFVQPFQDCVAWISFSDSVF